LAARAQTRRGRREGTPARLIDPSCAIGEGGAPQLGSGFSRIGRSPIRAGGSGSPSRSPCWTTKAVGGAKFCIFPWTVGAVGLCATRDGRHAITASILDEPFEKWAQVRYPVFPKNTREGG
jgi:hypothetical protein